MNFDLTGTCANCPFRTDIATNYGWLSQARAEGIVNQLKEHTFSCHKTTIDDDYYDYDEEYDEPQERPYNPKEQHCYGALVMLEHEGILFENRMIQIAHRFGLFKNPDNLKLNLPIVQSREQFIAMHSDSRHSFVMHSLLSMGVDAKQRLVNTYTAQLVRRVGAIA